MVPMPSHESLSPVDRRTTLSVARESIAYGLDHGRPLPVRVGDFPEALQARRASFVTLNEHGQLRGCIGALEASMPLIEDVAQHAFAAAFQDPRFPPLGREELARVDIHISVLTPRAPVEFNDERDLIRQLQPGVDGLVIAKGGHQATFLPSVWESLPDPVQFLAHLKLKAGLTELEGGRAWRYATESWGETEYG